MTRRGVSLDPAVTSILGDGDRRQQRRSMTAKERYDAKRVRATYDIEMWLRDAVKREADRLGTSASQLATLLIAQALGEYVSGEGEMVDFVYQSKRPRPDALRIECDLVIPDRLRALVTDNDTV